MKTPLSSQVGNLVFIPAFNVLSSVLSIVFFLRDSSCFPAISALTNAPTTFYEHITGDSKEKNTVLPPVRQLNVSDLLCMDLTKVYCCKVSLKVHSKKYAHTYEYEYHTSTVTEILIPSAASEDIIFLILSSPHD
jgi:hypothetical protein